MEDYNEYLLKVRLKGFKTRYVKFIDWENENITFTQYEDEAGAFEPYERAVQVANFLETQDFVKSVEIITV